MLLSIHQGLHIVFWAQRMPSLSLAKVIRISQCKLLNIFSNGSSISTLSRMIPQPPGRNIRSISTTITMGCLHLQWMNHLISYEENLKSGNGKFQTLQTTSRGRKKIFQNPCWKGVWGKTREYSPKRGGNCSFLYTPTGLIILEKGLWVTFLKQYSFFFFR